MQSKLQYSSFVERSSSHFSPTMAHPLAVPWLHCGTFRNRFYRHPTRGLNTDLVRPCLGIGEYHLLPWNNPLLEPFFFRVWGSCDADPDSFPWQGGNTSACCSICRKSGKEARDKSRQTYPATWSCHSLRDRKKPEFKIESFKNAIAESEAKQNLL